jgi:hypothetical protein
MVKITLTRHAKAKLEERALTLDLVRTVVEGPEHRFYDVVSDAEVSIGGVEFHSRRTFLAAVFITKDRRIHIVTAYTCKGIQKEIERKERLGRWLRLVG